MASEQDRSGARLGDYDAGVTIGREIAIASNWRVAARGRIGEGSEEIGAGADEIRHLVHVGILILAPPPVDGAERETDGERCLQGFIDRNLLSKLVWAV